MRLRFAFTVEIDAIRYADWAGIDVPDVRRDLTAYITSSIPDLPGLCQTGAGVRYDPRPGRHIDHRAPKTRTEPWPTLREGD